MTLYSFSSQLPRMFSFEVIATIGLFIYACHARRRHFETALTQYSQKNLIRTHER
jgi:hypothetical protein